jgi:hypothetical protein
LARGAAGNILITRSGVNCDITAVSLTSENTEFGRVSNPDAIELPVCAALSAPIIRDDASA